MLTLTLIERRASEVELPAEDLAFLLEHHARHLRLEPSRQPGHTRLTPTRLVGVIVGPSCRFVLRPKLPMRSLLHLLEPSTPVRVQPGPDEGDLLDFLARRLADLLSVRVAAGLRRAYVEADAEGPFLQGRLDVPRQLRQTDPRTFHYRRDELTVDVACNRVARGVGDRLLASPLIGEVARAALRAALAGFEGVSSVPLTPELFDRAAGDSGAVAYRPLLDLARVLADSLPGGPAFLLDLERVFERHVTRGVQDAFAGRADIRVAVQPRLALTSESEREVALTLRPDVVVEENGTPRLVIDAKWKRPRSLAPFPSDLHQILAYCASLGVQRGMLVYPGRRNASARFMLPNPPIRVEMHNLRVMGSVGACEQSLRRFGVHLGDNL